MDDLDDDAPATPPPPKIAVVVRDDLAAWQALNVTAFLVSGIGSELPHLVGEPYVDGSGVRYLPMFGHPVLVFAATPAALARAADRARARGLSSRSTPTTCSPPTTTSTTARPWPRWRPRIWRSPASPSRGPAVTSTRRWTSCASTPDGEPRPTTSWRRRTADELVSSASQPTGSFRW